MAEKKQATKKQIQQVVGASSAGKQVLILCIAVVLLLAAAVLGKNLNSSVIPDMQSGGVLINEVSCSGQTVLYDENGDYYDFIELYNPTANDIDMTGWYISDNVSNPTKYRFGSLTIKAGEYIVIFASGRNVTEGYIHTNFKLSAGESVYLYSSSSTLIDSVTLSEAYTNISYGRSCDDIEKWVYFSTPTPGRQNSTRSFDTPDEAARHKGGPLFISEILASSTSELYEGEDFIEIYNMSDEAVNLSGWYLSDAGRNIFKWAFPENTVIEAKSYLVLVASGRDDVISGVIHTNFKLSKYDEELILSHNGLIYDTLSWGVSETDVSIGINNEDDIQKRFYTTPTPNDANSESYYTGVSPYVFASLDAGCYAEAVSLELYTMEGNGTIYYTTDGSIPDSSSNIYTEALLIDENTCVRAMSVYDGRLPSEVLTSQYIIGSTHDLPVVFITIDQSDFNTIYTDAAEAYRPRVVAHITLVEEDKTIAFSEDILLDKHGNMSALEPQKSFSVYFRESVGKSSLDYNLFPDDDAKVSSFKSFILRTGGNDWDAIKIKDGMLQTLGATEMDLDYQGFRPCVVYINGQYWGLYNIREKENEDYLASYYNVDPDNVDIISFGYGIHEGDYVEYNKLIDYVRTTNLDNEENWQKLEDMMDVDNFIDTHLMHIYYGNFDTVNIKWWREKTEDGKWRWFTYDLDYALYYPGENNLALITDPEGHGVDKIFSSTLIYNLMRSDTFRERFLDRVEMYWTTIFAPDNILNHWYAIYDTIESEIPNNLSRWNISASTFRAEMHEAYDYIVKRPGYFRTILQNYFGLSTTELNERFPLQEVTVEERVY